MGRRRGKSGKIQIIVYLEPKINSDLRSLIQKKYGKFMRGLLSLEVNEALRYWIKAYAQSTQDMHNSLGSFHAPITETPKIYAHFERFKAYLQKAYNLQLSENPEIDENILISCIKDVFGSDKRTVKKYFNEFVEHGLIKVKSTPKSESRPITVKAETKKEVVDEKEPVFDSNLAEWEEYKKIFEKYFGRPLKIGEWIREPDLRKPFQEGLGMSRTEAEVKLNSFMKKGFIHAKRESGIVTMFKVMK